MVLDGCWDSNNALSSYGSVEIIVTLQSYYVNSRIIKLEHSDLVLLENIYKKLIVFTQVIWNLVTYYHGLLIKLFPLVTKKERKKSAQDP